MRLQQRLTDCFAELVDSRVHGHAQLFEHDLPRERVAIGVQATRRQTDENVATPACPSISGLVHSANDESSEIVFAIGVEARHLRRLAAEKRTSVLTTAACEAFDDLFGDVGEQTPGGEIVEKEQGARALHEDVVHAVIDEIDTVRCAFAMNATFSFVLTPSALATRITLPSRWIESKQPPNDPISERTPAVNVDFANALIRRTVSLPVSMSTPDAL